MMTDEVQTITNMASCAENVISSHDDNDLPGQDASEVSVSSGKRKTGPNSNQPIWDYFRDVENGVQCILCKTKLKMKERFTSNAKKHLKSRHKDKVQEFEEMEKLYNEKPKKDVDHSQANIGNFFVDVKSKGRPCSKNQLRKLAIFIAGTSVPFSIIDTSEFEEFCQSLIPNFSCPDKKTVLKEIAAIYSKMKENIMEELGSAGKISLCIDEWTKHGMNWSVIGITAHFFNRKTHKMERILLGMPKFDHPHTAQRISEMISSVLESWAIPQQNVWKVITDNAKNMTKAFKMVVLDGESDHHFDFMIPSNINSNEEGRVRNFVMDPFLEEEDEEFDDDAIDEYLDGTTTSIQTTFDRQKHLPCFIHTLVLAFKKAVDSEDSQVLEAKNDARRLVAYFSKSSKATERLKEIAGRKLIMPARTRWNYHYEMIKRLVDLKQHLSRVCEEQLIRNVQNWGVLVQLIRVLAPFAKWIYVLQGQKYPTIMYALPCLKELLAHLDELTQQNILPELCDAITFWINDYFKYILSMKDSGFNATYLVATALHPSLARSLKDTVEEPQLFRARQEIQNLLHLEIEISPNEQTAVVADIPVDESCSQVFCGGLFPHLQKEILHERPASMLSSISLVDDEVHSYFKQLPNYSIIDDALQFWIGNSSMFPNLSKLACDVLAIPAASAAVESVFSVCGHATSGRRHNLTVNLEKEVMIKVNKKFL